MQWTEDKMSLAPKIKIGTLGSAATFAGEAAARMREIYPEFSEPVYFSSMDECWQQLKKGSVDAVILGAERTGQPHHGEAVIAHDFYVIGESSQPLRCNLYVKPGARKSDIRKITGHGSIYQCGAYLDREFPSVPREAHGLNSVEAAKAVIAGDGTIAIVGSRSLPRAVAGLELFASGIDDGAISSWWAVASRPLFSDAPEIVVVTSRCGPDGQLGRLTGAMQDNGYLLQTAASFPVNTGVRVYDYILTFKGKGTLQSVQNTIARFSATRLVGAFDHRSQD